MFYNIIILTFVKQITIMPLRINDLEKYHIKLAERNEVFVWAAPCIAKKMEFEIIPMDGRKYECGGLIILANGLTLQASFRIKKEPNEPLLIKDSIYTKIDDIWYQLAEPAFIEKTELTTSEIFPIQWSTSIPMDHKDRGPYDENWDGE